MSRRGLIGAIVVAQLCLGGHSARALGAPPTPATGRDVRQEAANEKLVLDFYAALEDATVKGALKERIPDIAARYIAPGYIQHRAGGPNGRQAFVDLFRDRPAMPPPVNYVAPKLIAILSQGDKVVQVTSRSSVNPQTGQPQDFLIWNLFRVENGLLAEHWDTMQMPMGSGGPAAMPSSPVPSAPPR